MTDKEYERLDKKREIKKANGMDVTEEVAKQVGHIEELFSEMQEEGLFEVVRAEREKLFGDFLNKHSIVLWDEPSVQIKSILPALIADVKGKDLSLQNVKLVNVALIKLIDAINAYCADTEDAVVEKYSDFDREYMHVEFTQENFLRYLDNVFNDTLSLLNDTLIRFNDTNKPELQYMSSLLLTSFFYTGEISNGMEYGFGDEDRSATTN